MAEKKIGIIVDAKDNASNKFASMTKSMSSNLKTVSIAAAAAGAAVTGLLAIAVKDGAAAQSANKQLEYSIINITGATQEQLKATMDLADEIERNGVLAATNIKIGQAQLSTFGLSNKAVQGLSSSLADYAVNQFGVNASAEQLTQSANTFAKALKGQFGVLEKSGIRFTEAQQKMILYGTEMEKVQALNEGFAQNLKYTNEVALQTFEGQMAKLKVQIGNVSEEVGLALIPALVDLAEKVRPVVEGVLAWMRENPKLMQTIIQITAVVGGLLAVMGGVGLVIGPLVSGFQALAATFALLFSPIGAIVVAIAGITAAIMYLWNTNEGFRAFIVEAWTNIQQFISQSIQVISQVISSTMEGLKVAWAEDWGGIRTTVEQLNEWFMNEFLPLFQEFALTFQEAVGFLAEQITIHWDTIKVAWDTSMQAVQLIWNLAWGVIKATITTVWTFISGYITTGLALLRGDWSAAWEGIKGILMGVWEAIKTFIVNTVQEIWRFTSEQFAKIGIDIGGAMNDLLGNIQKVWAGIVATIQGAIDTLMGPIKFFIEQVGGAISSAMEMAKAAGSFVSGGLGAMKGRAVGGPISAGTPYMVGEQGPEYIVPDSRGTVIPTNQVGGGSSYNITITGNQFLSEDGAEQIGNMLFNNLRLQSKT